MPTKVFDAFTRLDASDVNGYLVNRTIRNVIINGGFDIWQRGTSFTSGSGYGPDRWFLGGDASTVSQQSTGAPAGSRFYARTTSAACDFIQYIESANIAELRGKQATYQVKVRRNATMNVSLTVRIDKSVTVDAGSAATWVTMGSSVVNNGDMPTGTTSNDWLTRSLTVTIPNDGTANSVRVLVFQTAAMTSGMSWDLAQVQLEEGAVDNDFRRNGNNIQDELAACQRYYWETPGPTGLATFAGVATGISQGSSALIVIHFPNTMRVLPSVSATGVTGFRVNDGISSADFTSLDASSEQIGNGVAMLGVNLNSSSVPAGNPVVVYRQANGTSVLRFAAEIS